MSFRDHFSRRAGDYARFRPTYPADLYQYLAGLTPGHKAALDCATGSGQAALALANHYDRVLATDASPEQIGRADRHEQVTYALAYAENVPSRDHVFDIVTVAAGLHWFNFEAFYPEVIRVTRPGGIIAAWSYYMFESEPDIEAVMDGYAHDVTGSHWPERMHLNQGKYRYLPFPFQRIETPDFYAEATWTMEQMLGFASTWSASQRFREETGMNPLDVIRKDLEQAWGDPTRPVPIRWPLHILVGRIA